MFLQTNIVKRAQKKHLPTIQRLISNSFPPYLTIADADEEIIRCCQYYDDHLTHYRIVICNWYGKVLAAGKTIPIRLDESNLNHNLPDDLSRILLESVKQHQSGVKPNILVAVSISIWPQYRNRGYSSQILDYMKEICKFEGLCHLVIPVRPTLKCNYPTIPIESYIQWKLDNQKVFDPWLRLHLDRGGTIVKVSTHAQHFSGTIQNWEDWTGLRFLESGRYVIPRALNLLEINLEWNQGHLYEPNVWVKYDI